MKIVAGTGKGTPPLAETVPVKSGRTCELVIRRFSTAKYGSYPVATLELVDTVSEETLMRWSAGLFDCASVNAATATAATKNTASTDQRPGLRKFAIMEIRRRI